MFLSRVSPMKNLAFAIKILGRISSKVTMDVIGPIEDESYWRDCEAAIALLPDHVKINLQGPVPHDEVAEALGRYDMFVLPTLGETTGTSSVKRWQPAAQLRSAIARHGPIRFEAPEDGHSHSTSLRRGYMRSRQLPTRLLMTCNTERRRHRRWPPSIHRILEASTKCGL